MLSIVADSLDGKDIACMVDVEKTRALLVSERMKRDYRSCKLCCLNTYPVQVCDEREGIVSDAHSGIESRDEHCFPCTSMQSKDRELRTADQRRSLVTRGNYWS